MFGPFALVKRHAQSQIKVRMHAIPLSAVAKWTRVNPRVNIPKIVDIQCPHCRRVIALNFGDEMWDSERDTISLSARCPACGETTALWVLQPSASRETCEGLYMHPPPPMTREPSAAQQLMTYMVVKQIEICSYACIVHAQRRRVNKKNALCMRYAYGACMSHTMLRVPNDLWQRIKSHAKRLKKSATATAVECISDSLDEMEAKKPNVSKIVQLSHFLKGSK
jgi:hypothetical protein